jgi:hypothetical protein
MNTSDLLNCSLAIAVPLATKQYEKFPERWEADKELIVSYADVFAHQVDELLFREEGVSGQLFAKLARALAWASFLPGGVRFNGVLYEANSTNMSKSL